MNRSCPTRPTPTRSDRRRVRRGFTLMEVLLVLAILGVIGALVVPNLLGSQQTANIKAAKNEIKRIEGILETYAINNAGQLPEGNSLSVLTQETEKEGIKMPPLLDKLPKDPWGNEYKYTFPAKHQKLATKADIWSPGPDKKDGTEDDITNWSDLEDKD